MKTTEYISAIKARHNVTSDYAVSKLLGVSRTSVSEWQKGKGAFGTLTCFKVAELLGDQPAAVIADIELERAEQLQKEDDADAWRKWVKRLGGSAAGILLAAGLGGFPNADAQLAQPQNSTDIYIVSNGKRRKKASPWDQLLRLAQTVLAAPGADFTPA